MGERVATRTATRPRGPRLARHVAVEFPGRAGAFALPTAEELTALDYGTIEEPPAGTPYVWGRVNGQWNPVVPLAGATMLGSLYTVGDPQTPPEASNRNYVDTRVFDGGYYD